ncbi:hypothetical protein NLU13_0332 [Sarocladium strictum]|uniref:Woronin body major protein n=1 Tax=Sarocladium strictum TaxID=5046 RepID=A0AA39LBE6_SARSR|nr:hypothetical protein NLU13_0332 [Sarocladium strictum]
MTQLRYAKVVNLDFEARVPVPFSIFPSTYRDNDAQTEQVETEQKLEVNLPQKQPAGREGQYSSGEHRYTEEEVRITREEERYRRPGFKEEHYVREEHRPSHTEYHDTHIEIDTHRQPYASPVDIAEREYRERLRPAAPRDCATEYTVDARFNRPTYREEVRVCNDTEPARFTTADQKSNMGYYDEDGHYHSFRQGIHKLADRINHPRGREEIDVEIREERTAPMASSSRTSYRRESSGGNNSDSYLPNTVTIPCHHIRIGDFLMLQGRPCQVIKISVSAATGQYRYLGVDLFTKQLNEESSYISNPAPSVVVQTMMGPIFKQYRVLDMADGYIVAMTETGDIKQNLAVSEQSNLWARLSRAFDTGRGSVRVLVLNDNGNELAVDMKVMHGSRL